MRKWEAMAIVLSLGGCVAPGGGAGQLRQAASAYAPMPARTPRPVQIGNTYRPEGTTLYGVGEAAPHGEEVPRSPNKRVLPPTVEPGLWAADEPRAAREKSPDLPPPTVDELLAATPSQGAPEAPGCRQRLLRASRTAGHEEARRNLPPPARDCLNARLLLHCVLSQRAETEDMARRTPRIDGVDYVSEHKRNLDAVNLWQLRVCRNISMFTQFEAILADIVNAYARQKRGAPGDF